MKAATDTRAEPTRRRRSRPRRAASVNGFPAITSETLTSHKLLVKLELLRRRFWQGDRRAHHRIIAILERARKDRGSSHDRQRRAHGGRMAVMRWSRLNGAQLVIVRVITR